MIEFETSVIDVLLETVLISVNAYDEELAKTFEAFSARHVAATLDRDDETPESDSDGASDGDYQDEDEDEDGEDDDNEPEQRPHVQAGECPVQ